MSRRYLAVGGDLFFAAKIRETARLVGAIEVDGAAAGAPPDLVFVDLEGPGDPLAVAAACRAAAPDARIVGYVRHGNAARIEAAREAGLEVLARGGFAARLAELLAD